MAQKSFQAARYKMMILLLFFLPLSTLLFAVQGDALPTPQQPSRKMQNVVADCEGFRQGTRK